jgi:hypothetical protein
VAIARPKLAIVDRLNVAGRSTPRDAATMARSGWPMRSGWRGLGSKERREAFVWLGVAGGEVVVEDEPLHDTVTATHDPSLSVINGARRWRR